MSSNNGTTPQSLFDVLITMRIAFLKDPSTGLLHVGAYNGDIFRGLACETVLPEGAAFDDIAPANMSAQDYANLCPACARADTEVA